MTLEEYEKVLEEKRKSLAAEKSAERKVEADKAFESMQLVDNKKREEDIFIKLVGYLVLTRDRHIFPLKLFII